MPLFILIFNPGEVGFQLLPDTFLIVTLHSNKLSHFKYHKYELLKGMLPLPSQCLHSRINRGRMSISYVRLKKLHRCTKLTNLEALGTASSDWVTGQCTACFDSTLIFLRQIFNAKMKVSSWNCWSDFFF